MKLRNAILSGLMFGLAHGIAANAEPTKGYYTMDAMGCMLCLLYTSPSPRD